MFLSQVCPAGCDECKESGGDIVCDKCLAKTHVQVAASKSECVGECQFVTLDLDFVAPV